MIEHEEGNVVIVDRDDITWISTCCTGTAITEFGCSP